MAMLPGHLAPRLEEFDRADEQLIRVALERVDGEEISPACHAITPLVWHSSFTLSKGQVRELSLILSWRTFLAGNGIAAQIFHTMAGSSIRRNTRVRYCALRGLYHPLLTSLFIRGRMKNNGPGGKRAPKWRTRLFLI